MPVTSMLGGTVVTKPAKIIVRELRPTDTDAYATMCETRDSFNAADARKRAELVQWIAFNNPESDKPGYFVAEQGDRLVGHIACMITRFQIGDRQVLGSFWHDLYVTPDVRATGAQGFFVSMKLYRAVEKASPNFAAMIWTNDINIKLQTARKYESTWFDLSIKRIALNHELDKKISFAPLTAIGKPLARAALQMVDRAIRLTEVRARQRIEQIHLFDERFDALADRIGPQLGVSPVKTAAYLNWKYMQRPHIDCAAYATFDTTGEPTGFIICARDSDNCGIIADFSVDPNDREIFVTLLDKAHSHFRSLNVDRIDCVATDQRFQTVLNKMLYFRRPPKCPLFLYKAESTESAETIRDIANWHITLGDSEGPF